MEEDTVANVVKQENACSDVVCSASTAELKSEIEKLQCELNRARTALNRSNNMLSRVLSASEPLNERLNESEEDRFHARIILQYVREEKELLEKQLHDLRHENDLLKEQVNSLQNPVNIQADADSSNMPSTSAAITSIVTQTDENDTGIQTPIRTSKRVREPTTSHASTVISQAAKKRQPNGTQGYRFSARDAAYAEKNKDKRNFACDLCPKTFMKLGLLKFHKRRSHKIKDIKVEFGCVDCGEICGTRKVLKRHRQVAHPTGN